jgi:3-hydroxyacyl-[acyl-carrier-protein] dehydratase
MLADDFYILRDLRQEERTIFATLVFDPQHPIFQGHFPGQPVVPGVCMMQIIKELLEKALGVQTRLAYADHAKFLSLIDPQKVPEVQAEIKYTESEEGALSVVSTLLWEETTFLKYKAQFIPYR